MKKLSAPVVDTTGAGDAFNGAFSVALSKNKNFKEAIEFANLVAGISVTREGAANSMPTIDEIEENLQWVIQRKKIDIKICNIEIVGAAD